MARATIKMSGGMAKYNLADHAYLVKSVPMNPYIGSVHDGKTTEYEQGFAAKHIPFLYRFVHNQYPGMQTGFFSRNPGGKYQHWLEVSTIEKMRVRVFTDEAAPPVLLSILVILFTMYHIYRYTVGHPDITLYNIVLWTTKPWVRQVRFAEKHPLDRPVFRYIHRVPEVYGMEDPEKVLIRLGCVVNDPFINKAKELGLGDQMTPKVGEGEKAPDVVAAVFETVKPQGATWRFQP